MRTFWWIVIIALIIYVIWEYGFSGEKPRIICKIIAREPAYITEYWYIQPSWVKSKNFKIESKEKAEEIARQKGIQIEECQ